MRYTITINSTTTLQVLTAIASKMESLVEFSGSISEADFTDNKAETWCNATFTSIEDASKFLKSVEKLTK